MAYLLNTARLFADEFAAGLAAAHPGRVRTVPGGIVRATETAAGSVAVITGGGTGHYPAFGGLVGAGLAHGAALGNVFASPSAQQVQSVAAAAHRGGGVLLTFGNYAGDILNFRAAAQRLGADKIDVRIVEVTDDISSAPPEEASRRRGIAGGLIVYKIAGAAADRGADLDEVERLARAANDRTRTLGVAFSGCTLPGSDHPLFTVPAGRMAVGMGIHGEPGISEMDIPTADGLAELLVSRLLAERPEAAEPRVVVLVNGLGSVAGEELYVIYRRVVELLSEAGIRIEDAEVGELVTSFEMAGVSMTTAWLDDELLELWSAPADAPAFRKGQVPTALAAPAAPPAAKGAEDEQTTDRPASLESQAAARRMLVALEAVHEAVVTHVDELGRLDAIAGDGDHGIGMERGASAAVAAAERAVEGAAGAGATLAAAADAWSDRAGGTSGLLWGIALSALAESVGDERAPDVRSVSAGVRAAVERISEFGRARLGDKTLLDAMIPFAETLETHAAAGEGMRKAWSAASSRADDAATATAHLTPRIGRARPLAEKSIGTPDPGAVSFALAVSAVSHALGMENSL